MRISNRILCTVVLLFTIGAGYPGGTSGQVEEGESVAESMRRLSRQLLDAYGRKDVAAIKSFYAQEPDAIFFWERQMTYSWKQVESTIDSFVHHVAKVKLTASDVRAGGSGATGWLAATFREEREDFDGKKTTTEGRWTLIAEKRNGRWVIVHEHASLPAPEQ